MKHRSIILAGAIAFAAAAGAATAADMSAIIPEDAFFAVWVDDVAAQKQEFESGVWGKHWNAPELTNMRELVQKSLEEVSEGFETDTGFQVSDFPPLFQKGVAIFSTGLAPGNLELRGGSGELSPDIALYIELTEENRDKARELVERIVAEADDNLQKSSYEVGSTTVYSFRSVEEEPVEGYGAQSGLTEEVVMTLQYAFAGDFLMVAIGNNEPLRKLIPMISSGSDQRPLSSSESFRRSLTGMNRDANDLQGWFNYDSALRTMLSNAPEPNAIKIGEATGILGSGPMHMAFNWESPNSSWDVTILTPPERKGLLAVLQESGDNPLKALTSTPAEATTFSSFTLNVGVLWREVTANLTTFAPEAIPFINFGLANIQQQAGVDLVADVLNNLSGEHFQYIMPLDRGRLKNMDAEVASNPAFQALSSGVFGFSMLDGDRFKTAIVNAVETFKANPDAPAPVELEEIQGFTVLKPAKDVIPREVQLSPSIAFLPSGFVFSGDDTYLNDILRRASGGGRGSLADHPHLKRFLSTLDYKDLRFFKFVTEEGVIDTYDMARDSLRDAMDMDEDAKELYEAMPPTEFLRGKIGHNYQTVHLRPGMIHLRIETVIP